MPPSSSASRRRPSRIAPFAPLAIAVLLQNAVIPTGDRDEAPASTSEVVAAKCEDVETMEVCHTSYPTGCSNSDTPRYDAFLNLMKNQLVSRDQPVQKTFTTLKDFQDLDARLPAGLKKGNHGEFRTELAALGEGRVFATTGYLYYVSKAGAESVNCNLTAAEAIDLHIGIGFDKSLAAQVRELRKARKGIPTELKRRLMMESVVVEMTPHFRATVAEAWSFEGVRAQEGMPVRVTGQLMADNEHNIRSQNCALPGADLAKCWRASAWELHPVTRLEVCANESGCDGASASWVNLEDLGS